MKTEWFITIYLIALVLLGWCFQSGVSFSITSIFFFIVLIMTLIIILKVVSHDPKEELLKEIRDELRKKNKHKTDEPLEGEVIE